jgi:hypothetical protein
MTIDKTKLEGFHCVSEGDLGLREDEIVSCSSSASMTASGIDLGSGTIQLTNQRVIFTTSSGTVSFSYRSMVMHAVATHDENTKYLFIQLQDDDSEELLDVDDYVTTDAEKSILKLTPSDLSETRRLFDAFNEMSALNPDEDLDEDVEEMLDEII